MYSFSFLPFGSSALGTAGDSVIAILDDEPIHAMEYLRAYAMVRPSVIYDVVAKEPLSNSFNQVNQNISPNGMDVLKSAALSMCIRIKMQEILMKEQGILPDISYSSFCKDYKSEMENRLLKTKKGEPVYGPVQMDEKMFFNYRFSSNTTRLKNKLREVLKISPSESFDFKYENMIDALIKNAKVQINQQLYNQISLQ